MSPSELRPRWIRSLHYPYYVNSVAVSGDGRVVVAGTFYHVYEEQRRSGATGEDGTFGTYCFAADGTPMWRDTFAGWQGIYWVALSRNGAWAASGGWYSQNPYQGILRAYAVGSGERVLDHATASRVNAVALSADGTFLVAAAEALHLFHRGGDTFDPTPSTLTLTAGDTAETVALSQDGRWVACGTYQGDVVLAENRNGALGDTHRWSLPGGGTIHCVSMSDDGAWIAVGASGGALWVLSRDRVLAGEDAAWSEPLAEGGSIYFAAVSGDGAVISAVVNDGSAGAVYVFANEGCSGTLLWRRSVARNPNSTSLDWAGRFVAVADGHPDGTPGHFYLFDRASGTLLGMLSADTMCWPMFLAADGSAIAAGCDDSSVYYFVPPRT